MVFSKININDKQLFEGYLQQHGSEASELTFTNLFMWRKFYRFRYSIISGLLCIIAEPQKTTPFALIPIGKIERENFTAALKEIEAHFAEKNWPLVFRRVTGRELEFFSEFSHGEFVSELDRDNSDYIYNSTDLINLKGKKYDGKRNHINKFNKNHTFEYVVYSKDFLPECDRIMEEWCRSRDCDCKDGEYCERFANMELLENIEQLGCKAALLKVDGRFEAFTVGEMMNNETAVIHIEKAGTAIDGLYTVINQQFCTHEWSNALYINREQDLGMEGLRKAKLSYNPVRMIDKYIVDFSKK